MKRLKYFVTSLLVALVVLMSFGCYMVSGQKMDRVKGTYKLTDYTRIPQYERREGYTPKTINYLTDEDYQYEDYLVVTGSGSGYYVHKDVNTSAYSKEITLSYQYDEENNSLVEYVVYNDSVSVNASSGVHKLGVTKGYLNYSKPAFDYTELFSKRSMRSEDINVRWERVDKATDLSYVEKQLGTLKKYEYQDYAVRGIYEWEISTNIETGETVESDYQYYYIVIDTAQGVTTAKISYALKETPTERVNQPVNISHTEGDWNSITIDGVVWSIEPDFGTYYYSEVEGVKRQIVNRSSDVSDARLDELIADRMAMD